MYIHIHTYTYIYMHIHTYTYIYTHIHTYTHIYIHTCVYIHIYIYIYIYIWPRTRDLGRETCCENCPSPNGPETGKLKWGKLKWVTKRVSFSCQDPLNSPNAPAFCTIHPSTHVHSRELVTCTADPSARALSLLLM